MKDLLRDSPAMIGPMNHAYQPEMDSSEVVDDRLRRAMSVLAPIAASFSDEIRMVGTASSWLRGIVLPVGDIDVLARTRLTVDGLAEELNRRGVLCRMPPSLLDEPGFTQYYTSFEIHDVKVEVSTVEAGTDGPLSECAGPAPWSHFDGVLFDDSRLFAVASELRLLSEVSRNRPERWEPIGRHLEDNGYDAELLDAACSSLPDDLRTVMNQAVGNPVA